MRDTGGEVGTNSLGTYSCGPLHMDEQSQDDQLEPTYNNCADTGCSHEDTPETMDDREGWRKRVIIVIMFHEQQNQLCFLNFYSTNFLLFVKNPFVYLSPTVQSWLLPYLSVTLMLFIKYSIVILSNYKFNREYLSCIEYYKIKSLYKHSRKMTSQITITFSLRHTHTHTYKDIYTRIHYPVDCLSAEG